MLPNKSRKQSLKRNSLKTELEYLLSKKIQNPPIAIIKFTMQLTISDLRSICFCVMVTSIALEFYSIQIDISVQQAVYYNMCRFSIFNFIYNCCLNDTAARNCCLKEKTMNKHDRRVKKTIKSITVLLLLTQCLIRNFKNYSTGISQQGRHT